jgi:DNA polymerase IIIc chi subunit
MEVWFYHLQSQRLEQALPALLERALANGWRTVVHASSEERLDMLDEVLWTYADASFLAHGRAQMPPRISPPIPPMSARSSCSMATIQTSSAPPARNGRR